MHDTKTARTESVPASPRGGPDNATRLPDNGWKLEMLALAGFCVSGVFFIMAGLRSGDVLTVLGSVVWIISCFCWMLPYRKHVVRKKSSRQTSLP